MNLRPPIASFHLKVKEKRPRGVSNHQPQLTQLLNGLNPEPEPQPRSLDAWCIGKAEFVSAQLFPIWRQKQRLNFQLQRQFQRGFLRRK